MALSAVQHQQMIQLVQQHLVHEVFLLTIQADQRKIATSSLKLRDVYHRWMHRLEEHVFQQMIQVDRKLRQSGVRILSVKQKLGYREVQYIHQGFTYTDKLLNEWLKKECEQLFCTYTRFQ